MEPKSKKSRPRGHPGDPGVPGIGFLVIFASFLDSVLGPVAPKFEHFSRPDFLFFQTGARNRILVIFAPFWNPFWRLFRCFWTGVETLFFDDTTVYNRHFKGPGAGNLTSGACSFFRVPPRPHFW